MLATDRHLTRRRCTDGSSAAFAVSRTMLSGLRETHCSGLRLIGSGSTVLSPQWWLTREFSPLNAEEWIAKGSDEGVFATLSSSAVQRNASDLGSARELPLLLENILKREGKSAR